VDTPAALKQRVGGSRHRAQRNPNELSRLLSENTASPARPSTAACRFWSRKGTPSSSLLTADRPTLGGISVRRPTLDDVFLSLTGRQIREEGRGSVRAPARDRAGAAECWR
jgi:ABC-2 type transport system ATP-binding protein